jgi:1-phosphofructokinase family hexose kinase
MPRKIITVTLNSSIDVIVDLPCFIENSVLDADSYTSIAAGKGINVARALSALGERVLALGIVGKDSKQIFSTLPSRRIQTDFVCTEGASRRNITIIQKESGAITHIHSNGYGVDGAVLSRVRRKLQSSVDKNDIVVFCGSLPKGMNDNMYAEYIELCTAKGACTILDTADAPLRNAVAAAPRMIKCNKQEFQTTFGLPPQCDDYAIVHHMKKLVQCGILYVAVTLGSGGVLVLKENDENAMKAYLGLGNDYAGRKVVGSGDALLAGFAYGIKKKLDTTEMIRWGVACGAANMFSKIPGDIDMQQIKQLMKQVRLEYVSM